MAILRRIAIALHIYWLKNPIKNDNEIIKNKFNVLWHFFKSSKNNKERDYLRILHKLNVLRSRISGELKLSKETITNKNITASLSDIIKFTLPTNSYSKSNEIAYPIANAKEAEDLLIETFTLIDEIRSECHIPDFVLYN